jgi:hypothetical protein
MIKVMGFFTYQSVTTPCYQYMFEFDGKERCIYFPQTSWNYTKTKRVDPEPRSYFGVIE